jgi:hypothetical protein
MKRQALTAMRMAIACVFLFSLQGCLKDNCRKTYTIYKPVYQTLTSVRAGMNSSAPRPIQEPGKIYVYGNYIFLNEMQKGIHIIDNSQPTAPKNIAFLNIPGNVDMAVKGNILYADSYSDLVAFDISDPKQAVTKKFLNNVFPHRSAYYVYNSATYNPDSILVIAGWTTKDTTVECETYRIYYERYYSVATADMAGNYAAPSVGGMGGSMACFALLRDNLYTVSYNDVKTFDVSNASDPVYKSSEKPGNWNIETIYPFKDKLFIGTTNGMYIYDASNPNGITLTGQFAHVRSCDPVVADDYHAWVTLRSGTRCEGFTNQLDVIDISQLSSPRLVNTYSMSNPHGLSKDGNLLFICDGTEGLKVYDATDVINLKLIKRIAGMEAYDVIAWNKKALVTAKNGLYQFDYSNPEDIKLISTINLDKTW